MRDELDQMLMEVGETQTLHPNEKKAMLATLQEQMRNTTQVPNHNRNNQRWKLIAPASTAVVVAAGVIISVLSNSHHPSGITASMKGNLTSNQVTDIIAKALTQVKETSLNEGTLWKGIPLEETLRTTKILPVAPSTWVDVYDNVEVGGSKPKHYTLSQARSLVDFPIREPQEIPSWTRSISEGASTPVDNIVNNKHVGVTYTPITYFDVYTNVKGQQVSVQQTLLRARNSSVNLQYGPMYGTMYGTTTKRLTGFGGDLAFLDSNPAAGLNELRLFIKETNGAITTTIVDGNVDEQALALFALEYISAPVQ